jgi:hypothetical protein
MQDVETVDEAVVLIEFVVEFVEVRLVELAVVGDDVLLGELLVWLHVEPLAELLVVPESVDFVGPGDNAVENAAELLVYLVAGNSVELAEVVADDAVEIAELVELAAEIAVVFGLAHDSFSRFAVDQI